MKKIILASSSPRRQLLLQQIGLDFTVCPANIEENLSAPALPMELAQAIAFQKAQEVSRQLDGGIVIAADTIVVWKGMIMGKPENRDEAFMMLSRLSGQRHQVITGICIIDVENEVNDIDGEITDVVFSSLSSDEINCYLDSGEWVDKAGAYAIQGQGALLVDRIEGCYFNVVGLPLNRLKLMLAKKGINLLGVN
ncbi:MAG: septum formation inhibitor Maf [Firmicutes bacterium HGW-Firmicutes-15]|nr:MAG: septum formation inhibitor Maf [Firmicutes bacterium HGW-Firmicutes-15]